MTARFLYREQRKRVGTSRVAVQCGVAGCRRVNLVGNPFNRLTFACLDCRVVQAIPEVPRV